MRYDIEVTNTGNINLHGVSIFDQFLDNNGRTLNLISGPTYTGANLGSAEGSLKASETANYIAYYIIEQAVVDAGGLSNQVIVSASSGNSNISDCLLYTSPSPRDS